jgi:hypothetical protein
MFEMELVRFMADDGIGIAVELLFTGANVCACCQKVLRGGAMAWGVKVRRRETHLSADRKHARLLGHGCNKWLRRYSECNTAVPKAGVQGMR